MLWPGTVKCWELLLPGEVEGQAWEQQGCAVVGVGNGKVDLNSNRKGLHP